MPVTIKIKYLRHRHRIAKSQFKQQVTKIAQPNFRRKALHRELHRGLHRGLHREPHRGLHRDLPHRGLLSG